MNDTAIIVTTYCGGNHEQDKRKMTNTICKNLSKAGHFLVLASHSPIDMETQNYCDIFIYDKDNSFYFNGVPKKHIRNYQGYIMDGNHGVAELTSTHNGIKALPKRFKYFLKLTYDLSPEVNYHDIIEKCKNTGKKMVTSRWGNDITLGTMMHFCEIDFFNETLSMNDLYRCEKDLENVWFDSIGDRNLFDKIHILDSYENFFGYNIIQYANLGGNVMTHYPFE